MKKLPLIIGAAAAVVALIAWAALRKPAPQPVPLAKPPDELAGVPRTPLAKAATEVQGGGVTIIDVRDADSYIAGHIPGALQIPLARVEGEVGYLPRGKPILTYCT
jgi:3-mercaptopyruvate sulfurtransferase SseA